MDRDRRARGVHGVRSGRLARPDLQGRPDRLVPMGVTAPTVPLVDAVSLAWSARPARPALLVPRERPGNAAQRGPWARLAHEAAPVRQDHPATPARQVLQAHREPG